MSTHGEQELLQEMYRRGYDTDNPKLIEAFRDTMAGQMALLRGEASVLGAEVVMKIEALARYFETLRENALRRWGR